MLFHGIPYEGGDVEGVYTTGELAKAAAISHARKCTPQHLDIESIIAKMRSAFDEGNYSAKGHGCYYEIQRFVMDKNEWEK